MSRPNSVLPLSTFLLAACSVVRRWPLLILGFAIGTRAQEYDYGDADYLDPLLDNGLRLSPDTLGVFDSFGLPFANPVTFRRHVQRPQRRPNVIVILADDMVKQIILTGKIIGNYSCLLDNGTPMLWLFLHSTHQSQNRCPENKCVKIPDFSEFACSDNYGPSI